VFDRERNVVFYGNKETSDKMNLSLTK